MKHEDESDTNNSEISKNLKKKLDELEIRGKIDHSDHNTVENN